MMAGSLLSILLEFHFLHRRSPTPPFYLRVDYLALIRQFEVYLCAPIIPHIRPKIFQPDDALRQSLYVPTDMTKISFKT